MAEARSGDSGDSVENWKQYETDQLTYTLACQGADNFNLRSLFRSLRREGVMAYRLSRLPSRFPVGTKFVVEGRPGAIKRYIEFPDGTKVALPPQPERPPVRRRGKRRAA